MPVSASQPGAGNGQLLSNLASFKRTTGPPVVSHYDVRPVLDIFGGVSGRDLGGVLGDIQPLIKAGRRKNCREAALFCCAGRRKRCIPVSSG